MPRCPAPSVSALRARSPVHIMGRWGRDTASFLLCPPSPPALELFGKEDQQPNVALDIPRDKLTVRLERAFFVSVALPKRPWIGHEPLEELNGLATTAGAVVVGGMTQ